MKRLAAAFALILLVAPAIHQDSRAEAPPRPSEPCRFTLEAAPSTMEADGHKVTNWVLTCHRRVP